MERLRQVCATSWRHRRNNPPAMEVIYSDEGYDELADAARNALAQPGGADPAEVYRLVTGAMRRDGLDHFEPCIDGVLLPSVTADTIVDAGKRETVLHDLLSRDFPPPLVAEAEHPLVSLLSLLDRGATPDLQDASGNTALHLLVVRIAKEKIFPDLEPEMAFNVYDQDLMYRDDDRIEFLEGVGSALVRAGWSLDLPNGKGRTVRRLLQLSHHIAEAKRGALRRGLRQAIALAGHSQADAQRLQQQTQRQQERVDRMQAVLARLQELAPATAPA